MFWVIDADWHNMGIKKYRLYNINEFYIILDEKSSTIYKSILCVLSIVNQYGIWFSFDM